MKIRRAIFTDIDEIAELYRDTIIAVDAKDYTEEQIGAWSSTWNNQEGWVRRLEDQYFFVAIIENKIVGFASVISLVTSIYYMYIKISRIRA